MSTTGAVPDSWRFEGSGRDRSPPVLEVSELQAGYLGGGRVLHGVSLKLHEGGCVVLLGANGAGKTTTLKAISGMLADEGSVHSGRVTLSGVDVTGDPAHRMVGRGLVHVLEGRYVFPDLSVRDNLRMGAYSRRPVKVELERDLNRVLGYFPRLADRLRLEAGYLSGGEQQMLAVARALMARPRVLLLDEPSMGLSPLLVREVFAIIDRIRRSESLSVLLVEQNVRAALETADYAYLVESGRVVGEGAAREMKRSSVLEEAYLGGRISF